MARSFSPIDLVSVPRTSGTSAMALGTALITAAREEPELPAAFEAPLKRLETECDALRTSRQYQREADAIDTSVAGEADQQLDAAWSGLHGFLGSWAKLAAAPEAAAPGARARAVSEVVFPDGLRFLNLPYRDQWAESQTRLDRLGEPLMAEHVKALGGEAFVRVVEAAHARYGAALHLTRRKAEVQSQVKVRQTLEGVLTAVRSYVLRVASYADEHRDAPATQRVCRVLLEPLATWKSAGGSRKAPAPEAPPGGEPGGAPGDEGGPGDETDEPNEE